MKAPIFNFTTEFFPDMAGEPTEVMIYAIDGKHVTRSEWFAAAPEADRAEAIAYENDMYDSNEARSIGWVI